MLGLLVMLGQAPPAPAHTEEINSKIVIGYEGGFIEGQVTSPEDVCERNRVVRIYLNDTLLGERNTTDNGRWQMSRPNADGLVRAVAARKDFGGSGHDHTCKLRRSVIVKVGPVFGSGSYLADDGANDVTFAPDPCPNLAAPGWTMNDCVEIGNIAVGTTEFKKGTGGTAWLAKVWLPAAGSGEWATALVAGDETGGQFSVIDVLARNLGDGPEKELIFGYRIDGSGSYLAYDVVKIFGGSGPEVKVHRGEFEGGSADAKQSSIDDYYPLFRTNCQAPCSPRSWIRSTIDFSNGAYRIIAVKQVDQAVPSDLG